MVNFCVRAQRKTDYGVQNIQSLGVICKVTIPAKDVTVLIGGILNKLI